MKKQSDQFVEEAESLMKESIVAGTAALIKNKRPLHATSKKMKTARRKSQVKQVLSKSGSSKTKNRKIVSSSSLNWKNNFHMYALFI